MLNSKYSQMCGQEYTVLITRMFREHQTYENFVRVD